ncbi:hypothetical protein D6D08_08413 [Aureobasidium pullulans]|nr:hypothetical protein D6D08_08413 [Aureobasidium pullulans]
MSSNISNRNPIKARFTSGPRPCQLLQREARANLLSCNEKQEIIPRPSPLLDLPHELIKMIMIHVDDSSIIDIRSTCTLLKDETEYRFRALYCTDHKQHSILATCREMRDDALLLFWAMTILNSDNEVALQGFVSPP